MVPSLYISIEQFVDLPSNYSFDHLSLPLTSIQLTNRGVTIALPDVYSITGAFDYDFIRLSINLPQSFEHHPQVIYPFKLVIHIRLNNQFTFIRLPPIPN